MTLPAAPDIERLSLYYYTATRMEPRQLAGIAERKIRETLLPRLPLSFDERYERQVPEEPVTNLGPVAENTARLSGSLGEEERERAHEAALRAATGEITLLSHTVSVNELDWTDSRIREQPALWWTLLYAFDPLSKLVLGVGSPAEAPDAVRTFDGWLDDWIRTASVDEPGYLRGKWTPYCVSLRLRYWLQYLAWRGEAGEPRPLGGRLVRETYKNATFLSNHVEWDVGGNHLVDNGVALVAAGVALRERRWREQGVEVLEQAARTQLLADGGHVERSPMYHVAVLVSYLTACDLLRDDGHPVPESLARASRAATAFLEWLAPPDDELPLLNDAVHGYTLSLPAARRYAAAVGLEPGPDWGWGTQPSGYRWLRNEAGGMLVDGGPVGPPHLPGHSHNDLLAVHLWVGDRPAFVDTGVHDYEGAETRQYVRSVRAHNTVQVGDGEPIPIGGKYLMGRRTRPTTRSDSTAAVDLFEGRYTGHPAGGEAYDHHRAVRAGPDWWTVRDRITGAGERGARARFHCHPDVVVDEERDGATLVLGDGTELHVHLLENDRLSVGKSPYFPRFSERHERAMLELTGDGDGAIGLALTTVDEPVRAEPEEEGHSGTLWVGENRYEEPPSRL